MKNEEQQNKTELSLQTSPQMGTDFDSLVKGFDSLKQYSEMILKSSVYNKQLETVEDVMNAIMVGAEIGISPRTAIMLGKRLNANTMFSVIKGRGMGIDPITAIENIHIIPTSNGDRSVTGVHIISSQLSKAGVQVEILKDYAPLYKYIDGKGQRYDIDFVQEHSEIFFKIGDDGESTGKTKVGLTKTPHTYHTTIKFTRLLHTGLTTSITISYSLEQATDAKLYHGKHSITGVVEDGKGNWNENPATMLRNRCISIGGRIIASDYLQGVYEFSEIVQDDNDGYSTVVEENATILKDKEGNIIAGKPTGVQADMPK